MFFDIQSRPAQNLLTFTIDPNFLVSLVLSSEQMICSFWTTASYCIQPLQMWLGIIKLQE